MSAGTSTFLTIAEPGHAETRVLGSRFFGLSVTLADVHSLDGELLAVQRRYHDATHWCHASRHGLVPTPDERWSDAGEPHGTAGQPILREIRARDLTDTLVIVTRYFGGTKLGTGGLARAYAECAAASLDAATVRTLRRYDRLTVSCDYDDMSIVYRLARRFDANPVMTEGTLLPRFELLVAPESAAALLRALVDESAARISAVCDGSVIC